MSLEDPLEDYRIGPAETPEDVERQVAKDGRLTLQAWTKGGPPVALTKEALYFVDEGALFRVRRRDVTGLAMARAANVRLMRWGLVAYLLAIPFILIDPIVAAAVALLGGYLVTRGFLAQAILVRVKDARVPPFVIQHPKWRRVRSALKKWHAAPPT